MNRLLQGLTLLSLIISCYGAWAQPTYCTPAYRCGSPADPYISGVRFNALASTSACNGYKLFPETGTTTTTVERQSTYRATVEFRGTYTIFQSIAQYAQAGMVYIDFNADGDFAESETFTVEGSQKQPGYTDIRIPADAVLGKTRMRVRHRVRWFATDGAIGACLNGLDGNTMAYDTEDYTITIVESNPATPTCPTTSTPVNNATNITRNPDYSFTWKGATGGKKHTTYDLLLGESPAAMVPVALNLTSDDGYAATYNYNEFLNQDKAYYYRIQPKNSNGINTGCPVVKFTTAALSNLYYCTPSGKCSGGASAGYNDYFIKSVSLNTLDQVTTCPGTTGAYTLFPTTTATTTLTQGTSYNFTAETFIGIWDAAIIPYYGGCSVGHMAVWIDFNQNGSFEDAGEFFALSEQTSTSTDSSPGTCIGPTPSTSIVVPAHAMRGPTRMRVRAAIDMPLTASDACTNLGFGFGETEDYTITVAAPAACSALSVGAVKTDNTGGTTTPNGSITLTPTGGTAPYIVSWTGGNATGNTLHATALVQGVYYATITDANGCSFSIPPVYIFQTKPFQIVKTTAVNPACGHTGSIRLDVAGGVGPYTFDWGTTLLQDNNLTNLSAGIYHALIKDSQGTTLDSGPIELATYAYTYTVTNATCATDYSGEVVLTVTGGAQPYNYKWESSREQVNSNTSSITSAGNTTYTATITDTNGCKLEVSPIYVNGPDTIKVHPHITPVNCNGMGNTTGEISLNPNGNGPFRYEIFSFADYSTPLPLSPVEDAGGSRFTEVPPNDPHEPYILYAYDNNNCKSEWAFVSVAEIPPLDPEWGYQEVCPQESPLLTFLGYTPGMELVWYADAGATQVLGHGKDLTIPALTQSTTYYLADERSGCRSNIIAFAVNLLPQPPRPVITAGGNTTLCDNGTVSLSAPTGFQGYDWSTGDITRVLTVSDAGSYTVRVRNSFGCYSPVSDPVEVTRTTSAPRPVITASGPSDFCTGGSVQLTAPEGYSSYLWSDGITTRIRTVKQPGSYSVTVGNGTTCASEPSEPVVITLLPATAQPVVAVTGPTSFCTNSSTTLSVPAGYEQYLWSDGINTQTRTITRTGRYSVAVKSAGACLSPFSDAVNITVTPVPDKPVITVSGAAAFCSESIGDVELFAPSGYAAYRWSTGATTASITVTHSGNYTVTVIAGCESPVSDPVTIRQVTVPAPPQQLVMRSDKSLQVIGGGMLYEWRLDGQLLPETGNRLIVVEEGVYEVRSKNSEGCVSAKAVTYTYLVTAIEDEPISGLRIYPNPTHGTLTIEADVAEHASLQLITQQGVVLRQATMNLGDKNVVPLDGLPAGLYYLMIQKDQCTITRKVTILPEE